MGIVKKRSFWKKALFFLFLLVLLAGGGAFLGLWDVTAPLYRAGLLAASTEIGAMIDELDGVAVHYNGPISNVSGRNLAPDGYNLGQKYQCVEFVKRYYYEFYTHKMPDSYGNAKDFFDNSLADGAFNPKRGLTQYRNNSTAKPKKGDLLIFGPTAFNRYGHVAIVSGVADSEMGAALEFIQQNPGPGAPSRDKRAIGQNASGRWQVDDTRLLGWLRKE